MEEKLTQKSHYQVLQVSAQTGWPGKGELEGAPQVRLDLRHQGTDAHLYVDADNPLAQTKLGDLVLITVS